MNQLSKNLSHRNRRFTLFTLGLLALLSVQSATAVSPTVAFLLGGTTMKLYEYHKTPKVAVEYRVKQRVRPTFPDYRLIRHTLRNNNTQYLRLPNVRGHVCGHDGICLGY